MSELIYKELSYKIVGLAYEVDSIIGFGQKEKVYCDCLEELFKRDSIVYKRELYAPIVINEKVIAKTYLDFLVDGKIVVEVKSGENQYRQVCSQVFRYIKNNDIKLGLVLRFTKNGVRAKRIPNIREKQSE